MLANVLDSRTIDVEREVLSLCVGGCVMLAGCASFAKFIES